MSEPKSSARSIAGAPGLAAVATGALPGAALEYREVIGTIGEGFLLLDPAFRVLDVNAETLRLIGRSRADLIGQPLPEAWPESAGTPLEQACRQVLQERITVASRQEYRFRSGTRWLEVRACPFRDGVAVFLRDVTDAEKAREALQQSEDRFRAAMAATGVMWTNDADGRMRGEQPAWSALTGQSRTEYENYGWAAAVHPEDAQPTITAWNAAVAERRTFVGEHRVRRADGVWRTFSIKAVPVIAANGTVREWVGVHTDITERRQYEKALAVKEARVRLATDVVGLGIWTWNPLTDVVTWENQRIATIFGVGNDAQPVNAAVFANQYLHADDVAAFQKAANTTLAGTERFFFQGRIRRASDGALRWVELHGERHRIDPSVVGILGTVADITERKKGEQALHVTAEELVRADRRKSEFIVTLAHELRNPLAPIRNGLQVLRMAADNPATVARVTAVMERQVGQMVHLIDDLLDVTRIARGQVALQRERVEFKQIAAIAVETSLPLIEAGHHDLSVDLGEEALLMMADGARIAQVLSNLLNNAAKYSPDHGRIHLSARREEDVAVITVRDAGIGIPADALATIFDLFNQVGEHRAHAQGGLGIGLSLVRTMVHLHGGSVEACSAGAGLGSSFVIRLPLAAGDTARD